MSAEPRADSAVIGSVDLGSQVAVAGDYPGWIRVEAPLHETREYVFGWLPAERDGAATLTLLSFGCPAQFTVGTLGGLHPEQMRQCAYGLEIELEGILRVEARTTIFTGAPQWLAEESPLVLSTDPTAAGPPGSMFIHLPLRVALPAPEIPIRLRGHFDDPRSRACLRLSGDPAIPAEAPPEQILWCQQQFVVSSIDQ